MANLAICFLNPLLASSFLGTKDSDFCFRISPNFLDALTKDVPAVLSKVFIEHSVHEDADDVVERAELVGERDEDSVGCLGPVSGHLLVRDVGKDERGEPGEDQNQIGHQEHSRHQPLLPLAISDIQPHLFSSSSGRISVVVTATRGFTVISCQRRDPRLQTRRNRRSGRTIGPVVASVYLC